MYLYISILYYFFYKNVKLSGLFGPDHALELHNQMKLFWDLLK